jgi:hypothetical protein
MTNILSAPKMPWLTMDGRNTGIGKLAVSRNLDPAVANGEAAAAETATLINAEKNALLSVVRFLPLQHPQTRQCPRFLPPVPQTAPLFAPQISTM